MTLLTPGAALLAGALAIPALLAIYFLKLRRRPVVVGSTLFWRAAAEDLEANVPLKWLRPSWLLAMQLTALACLVVAAGRPALPGGLAGAEEVFVIIDRSASMRARDGAGGSTRLEEAKREALRALSPRALRGASGQITVIAGATVPEVVGGPTMSGAVARGAIRDITPSDEPGDLRDALELAASLASGGEEQEAPRPRPIALVFTDRVMPTPPPGLDTRAFLVGKTDSFNAGIVSIAARRDAQDPAVLRVFVRIRATGAEPTERPLRVSLDDRAVDARTLGFDATGEGTATVSVECPEGGVIEAALLGGDALESDDRAWLTAPTPRGVSILVVRSEESEEAGAGWLLTDVLRELNPGSLRVTALARLEALGAEALRDVDLVICDGVGPAALPPVASIWFGAAPRVQGLAWRESDSREVVSWARDHPALRGVSLDALRFERTLTLDAREAESLADGATRAAELASCREGAMMVELERGGVRHVLVGFALDRSTWATHHSFPVFLAEAAAYLTLGAEGDAGRAFRTGEAARIDPRELGDGPAELVSPSGRVVGTIEAGRTDLGVLGEAGVWRVGGRALAVNLASEEETLFAGRAGAREEATGLRASARAGGAPGLREVWHWFVLAAFVLLGVEWLAYAARQRISPGAPTRR